MTARRATRGRTGPRRAVRRLTWAAAWTLALVGGCGGGPQVVWQLPSFSVAPTSPLFTPEGVAFGHARGVSLIDRQGRVRCHFPAAGRVVATPRSDGERLFFGGLNQVFYAMDFDCRPLWRQVLGAPVDQAPEVVGALVHVGSHDGHIYALDAATGEVAWTFPELPTTVVEAAPSEALPLAAVAPPRASRHGRHRAHLAARGRRRGHRVRMGAPEVMAAMPEILSAAPDAPAHAPLGFGRATPVAVGGALFAVADDQVIYALDADTGALLGRHDLGAQAIGPPIMMHGLVVVATAAGEVRAIRRDGLDLAWTAAVAAQPGSVPHLLRSAIAFFTADARLVGLDPLSGKERWQAPTPQAAGGSAEFFGPWTVTYRPGAGVVAVDNRSGREVWHLPTGGDLPAHVGREGRRLWVLAGDGHLTCVELPEMRG